MGQIPLWLGHARFCSSGETEGTQFFPVICGRRVNGKEKYWQDKCHLKLHLSRQAGLEGTPLWLGQTRPCYMKATNPSMACLWRLNCLYQGNQ